MVGRPLKIAVFSDSALPILNGVSVSIDQTIREMRRMGHSVHLFTSSYPGHKEHDPNTHRFIALRTPFARDYPLAFPPFYPWLNEFRSHRFDIIHTHTPFTVGFVGLRWAESHEIPIVSTYHTHYDKYLHYIPLVPKAYVKYKISKHINFYYNHVNHVLTPSEASKSWLLRHAVRTPVEVVPTGIPIPQKLDRARLRNEFGISERDRVVLYAGRVAREKNLHSVFMAAQKVLLEDSRAVFWVVGDGPGRETYLKLARELNIGDRTTFFGFVPRKDVDRYYAAADVFLFASQTETQGLVVSEAMSYGLPAVVVNAGGAAESVESGVNGFAVTNDPGQLAAATLRLLQDEKLYSELSTNAVQSARKLSIPMTTDRILSVYRSVLGEELPKESYSYVR